MSLLFGEVFEKGRVRVEEYMENDSDCFSIRLDLDLIQSVFRKAERGSWKKREEMH
jgi:hypothetical protein